MQLSVLARLSGCVADLGDCVHASFSGSKFVYDSEFISSSMDLYGLYKQERGIVFYPLWGRKSKNMKFSTVSSLSHIFSLEDNVYLGKMGETISTSILPPLLTADEDSTSIAVEKIRYLR